MTYDAAPQYRPHPSMQPVPGVPQPVRRGRAFAIVAVVFAGLELLTAPLSVLVLSGGIRSGLDASTIGLLNGGVGALSAVLGLIAAVSAIVSIVRGEPARLLAGIALGIALAAFASLVSTGLQFVIFA